MLRFSATCRLPWAFDTFTSSQLKPIADLLAKDLADEISTGFTTAYLEVLRAVAENNRELLGECLEKNLFDRVSEGLMDVAKSGQKLTLINESSPVRVSVHNASLHIGASVNRSRPSLVLLCRRLHLTSVRFAEVTVYKDLLSPFMPSRFVLQVDCLIQSAAKLVWESNEGEVVRGRKDDSEETHLLRFEKEQGKAAGIFNLHGNLMRYADYAMKTQEQSPFTDGQWVVSDIDDALKGNPFDAIFRLNDVKRENGGKN